MSYILKYFYIHLIRFIAFIFCNMFRKIIHSILSKLVCLTKWIVARFESCWAFCACCPFFIHWSMIRISHWPIVTDDNSFVPKLTRFGLWAVFEPGCSTANLKGIIIRFGSWGFLNSVLFLINYQSLRYRSLILIDYSRDNYLVRISPN